MFAVSLRQQDSRTSWLRKQKQQNNNIRVAARAHFKIMPPRFNIPPITRILLITLVLQSAISFAIRYPQWTSKSDVVVPYVSLVPQLSLIYPWTFLTTTLVENNIITFLLAGVTLFYGGRYLERAWTSAEFAKFLLVASLIPNILTFGTLVIFFAITGDMHWT